jgi:uncharacterized protein YegJ (DUF2314 family)
MLKTNTRFVLLAALLCLSAPASADQTVSVASDDPVMNAAIKKARGSVDAFWKKLATPAANEDGFAVKLAISDDANVEHFWCTGIQESSGKRSCEINNDPELVTTVKIGQRVDIDPKIISDWMYMRDGKIVGGETIRAIIPKLPADQQEQYRALLAQE